MPTLGMGLPFLPAEPQLYTIQELAEDQIHWYEILLYTASKKEPLRIKGDLSMNS